MHIYAHADVHYGWGPSWDSGANVPGTGLPFSGEPIDQVRKHLLLSVISRQLRMQRVSRRHNFNTLDLTGNFKGDSQSL